MLRTITTSGFKSLIDFRLELEPGVNVLVGPNGAGKSNILKFMEFLSEISNKQISEAVSNSGGAGDLFYRNADNTLWPEIDFSVFGSTSAPIYWSRTEGDRQVAVSYFYEASIRLSENSVFYNKQIMDIHFSEQRDGPPDLRCVWEYDISNKSSSGKVEKFNVKKLYDYARMDKSDRKQLERFLSDDKNLLDVSIFWYLNFLSPVFRVISNDINSGKAYNINPSKVREPEDIAKVPGITFEGGGLASTLLALKKHSQIDLEQGEFPFVMYERHPVFDSTAYEQVQDFGKLVSEDIISFEARPDFIENKNRVFVSFKRNIDILSLPISFVSDGTAKWLALMAAIVTSRSAFCIEEPENFLHPKLQQEIVTISRAVSEQSIRERFVLMTTHSQTVLNALQPSEIIVTSRSGSGTSCRRPSNSKIINDMINKTGFGLGHFYLTGAIE